jgi:hypothetical protein
MPEAFSGLTFVKRPSRNVVADTREVEEIVKSILAEVRARGR